MGGDAFDGRCFHPVGDQCKVSFEVPIKRELLALVRAQVKALNSKESWISQNGRGVLQRTYSFSDLHVIANSITKISLNSTSLFVLICKTL